MRATYQSIFWTIGLGLTLSSLSPSDAWSRGGAARTERTERTERAERTYEECVPLAETPEFIEAAKQTSDFLNLLSRSTRSDIESSRRSARVDWDAVLEEAAETLMAQSGLIDPTDAQKVVAKSMAMTMVDIESQPTNSTLVLIAQMLDGEVTGESIAKADDILHTSGMLRETLARDGATDFDAWVQSQPSESAAAYAAAWTVSVESRFHDALALDNDRLVSPQEIEAQVLELIAQGAVPSNVAGLESGDGFPTMISERPTSTCEDETRGLTASSTGECGVPTDGYSDYTGVVDPAPHFSFNPHGGPAFSSSALPSSTPTGMIGSECFGIDPKYLFNGASTDETQNSTTIPDGWVWNPDTNTWEPPKETNPGRDATITAGSATAGTLIVGAAASGPALPLAAAVAGALLVAVEAQDNSANLGDYLGKQMVDEAWAESDAELNAFVEALKQNPPGASMSAGGSRPDPSASGEDAEPSLAGHCEQQIFDSLMGCMLPDTSGEGAEALFCGSENSANPDVDCVGGICAPTCACGDTVDDTACMPAEWSWAADMDSDVCTDLSLCDPTNPMSDCSPSSAMSSMDEDYENEPCPEECRIQVVALVAEGVFDPESLDEDCQSCQVALSSDPDGMCMGSDPMPYELLVGLCGDYDPTPHEMEREGARYRSGDDWAR